MSKAKNPASFTEPPARVAVDAPSAPADIPPLSQSNPQPDPLVEAWCDEALKHEEWHSEASVFVDEGKGARQLPSWLPEAVAWERAAEVVARRAGEEATPTFAASHNCDFAIDSTRAWGERRRPLRRDPALASLVELVATYGPARSWPLPWEVSYPRDDDSQKPAVNAGGKYVVKLWFAGVFRRVVVDDYVPVDEAGDPVVLSSAEPRELWPTVLAKAIYKLWALVGAGQLADFVGFACRALAGWLPGGATDDALRGLPTCDVAEVALEATAAAPTSPSKRQRRRVKTREPTADALMAAAEARNAASRHLRERLFTTRDELILIVMEDTVSPLLAVVRDEGFEPEVLVEWHCPEAKPEHFREPLPLPAHHLVTMAELERAQKVAVATGHCLEHVAAVDWAPLPPPKPMFLYTHHETPLTVFLETRAGAYLALRSLRLFGREVPDPVPAPVPAPAPAVEERAPVCFKLDLPEGQRFATDTFVVPAGFYQVRCAALHGARGLFASSSVFSFESWCDAYRNALGDAVEEVEGEHAAVPADTDRVLFRHLVEPAEASEVSLKLWFSEPRERPYVRLHYVDRATGEAAWLPLLEATRTVSSAGLVLTCVVRADRPLPSGAWALYARSPRSVALTPLEDVVYSRFEGSYRPNAQLRFFRDVIQTRVRPLYAVLDVCGVENLPLELRVYRRADLVDAVKGRGSVRIPCIWPDKDDDAPLVLEAFLDSDLFDVPVDLRSLEPYRSAVVKDDETPSSLQWRLEIAAAEPATLRPHADDEAANFALRQSWESSEPGRAERAAALRAQYLDPPSKKPPEKPPKKGGKEPDPEDARIEALGSVVLRDVELARQQLRRSLPAPVVVTAPPSSLPFVRTADQVATDAQRRAQRLAEVEDTPDNVKDRIARAADQTKRHLADHVAALRAWRASVLDAAQPALAAREAYRLAVAQPPSAGAA